MKRIINYFLDTYYLFRINLLEDEIKAKPVLAEGYSIQLIDSVADTNIGLLISLWEKSYRVKKTKAEDEVISTIERGDICLAAFYQGKLAGMNWCGGFAAINTIPYASLLKKDKTVMISHHTFVAPEHRGQKLQCILMTELIMYAKKLGYQGFYGFVGVKNFASAINCIKVFSEFKVIFHVKIDIPFFVFNFYPGISREKWTKCKI